MIAMLAKLTCHDPPAFVRFVRFAVAAAGTLTVTQARSGRLSKAGHVYRFGSLFLIVVLHG